MSEVYRKRGRVARWENGWLVRVVEHGEAIDDGVTFRCHPLEDELVDVGPIVPGRTDRIVGPTPSIVERDLETNAARCPLPAARGAAENVDATNVERVAREIQNLCVGPAILPVRPGSISVPTLRIERLIVTEGFAEHEFGEHRWSEETRRIHVALLNGRLRALVDLASFDTAEVVRIADALARAGAERAAPPRLRLAPNVSAALLPHLAGLAPISQTPGGVDGKGQPIVETVGENWYRPSYRVRPIRMPMNLRATSDETAIDRDLPHAIAILEPVRGTVLRVLIDERGVVYPATLQVTPIRAVAHESVFYPYAAGSFGAEMML